MQRQQKALHLEVDVSDASVYYYVVPGVVVCRGPHGGGLTCDGCGDRWLVSVLRRVSAAVPGALSSTSRCGEALDVFPFQPPVGFHWASRAASCLSDAI